ncbi:MAG: DNA methyltransferase [Aminipila sp.]
MGLIYKLADIVDECKQEYEKLAMLLDENSDEKHGFNVIESYSSSIENGNLLAEGNNLEFMLYLLSEKNMKGKIKLIYVDPPFFSKADYNSQVKISTKCFEKNINIRQTVYTDSWKDGIESYLRMIGIRLYVMRELLAEDGCIWMHLDWHAAHYVKIIMDEVFGSENFINEVIWNYKSGGSGQRRFARKHDTLLFYGKTNKYFFEVQKEKSYNRGMKPYRFKGVEEFQDEVGWYTLVNMKDVWQMDMVGRTSAERTGYATQKPEALLERILKSCTKEGDLCADFFGGSGTLAVTANKMKRNWITSDIGKMSIASIRKRLIRNEANFSVISNCNHSQEICRVHASCEKKHGDIYLITLHNYNLDEESMNLANEEEYKNIKLILEKDSLSLIDYWSLDFNFDGINHRPQIIHLREKGTIEMQGELTSQTGVISMLCVDVLGNTSKKLFYV